MLSDRFTVCLLYTSALCQRHACWLQASNALTGVAMEGGVAGAVVTGNLFCKQQTAVGYAHGAGQQLANMVADDNVCRAVEAEFALPHGHGVFARSASHTSQAAPPPQGKGGGGGKGASCLPLLTTALRRM